QQRPHSRWSSFANSKLVLATPRLRPRGGQVGDRSAVDERHVRLGKPSPVHRDSREGAFNLAEVIGREIDVSRSEVFLETFRLARTRDRNDPAFLGKEPGQGDLSRRRVLPSRDLVE